MHVISLLLVACGGAASSPDQPRNWCCVGLRGGEAVLDCGAESKPSARVCFCDGVLNTSDATCDDPELFTSGTVCGSAHMACMAVDQ